MGEFADLAQKLETLPERAEEAAREEVKDGLESVESRAKRNLDQNGTWWQGDIAQSMTVEPYSDGLHQGYSLTVDAHHARYVEFGTGSYFGTSQYPIPSDVSPYDAPGGVTDEMVENIEEWVNTKPVVPRHYETQSELAQAIAHTIAELGTHAQPYHRPAWYGYRERLIQNIRSAVNDEVEDTV